MYKLKFYGLGGQGMVTAAKTLSVAVSLFEDEYAITVPSYGAERRGAPVNTSIIVDNVPVRMNCFVYEPDIVVVSDDSYLDRGINVGEGINEKSVLVLNTASEETAKAFKEKFGFSKVYYADDTGVALKNIKRSIPNSAMLGSLARTGVVKMESVVQAVEEEFGKIGKINALAAQEAYDATREI